MTRTAKLTMVLVTLLLTVAMTCTVMFAAADALKYDGKYYSDFTSHDDVVAAAEDLNIQIAGEGMVLLKNEGDMLPFKSDVRNISVFGVRSDNLLLAGTGTGSVRADTAPTLEDSLNAAGFSINPALKSLYAADSTTTPKDEIYQFGRNITDSYKSYNDAAVIVFSRVGGENADVSTDIGEAADAGEHIDGVKNKHYLEFTNAEQELMEHVAANFDKVVVVLNASNPMELKELDQEKYGVDAALWISQPGQNGIMALGQILSGEINPSGKLVDTFEKDFTSSIVWNNYGTGVQAVNNDGTPIYDEETNPYPNVYRTMDGEVYGTVPKGNTPGSGFTEVQYEESIYLGYMFYETMWYEMEQKEDGSGDAWYEDQMQYTFGYGLSYTDFAQEITGVYSDETCTTEIGGTLTGDADTLYVKVNVTNTGKVAGKDVVQIYVNAPYYDNEIEKSYVKLVGFGKSDILDPQETGTVVVKVNVQDMASFDYNDANGNGEATYELDAGDYNLFAMKNSHEQYDAYAFSIGTGTENTDDIILGTDDFSGAEANALFSGEDEYNLLDYYGGFEEDDLQMDLVSRMDFKNGTYTQPEAATVDELKRDDAWFNDAVLRDYYAVADDKQTDGGYSSTPWADVTVPADWTQGEGVLDANGHYETVLSDMTGVEFDDEKWTEFMNQLTFDELVDVVSFGSHGTAAIPSINKEQTRETDGPISLSRGFAWCVAPLQAATWNTVLIERLGVLTANQAMLRWQDAGYTNANDLAGWYGPAMNIHRSHFLGRTFEYYSEDGMLSGYMAAAVVGGAQSKGLNCWIKHFVLNDQEIYRKGINTYCTEQAFRETYCKPFQMAIQEGNATGIMTSFNRIGQVAAAVNYKLIQELTRDEWGFDGAIVTDMYNSNCWPSTMLLRAGNDLPLGTLVPNGTWNSSLRDGKGSVEVTGVRNFSIERNYEEGDIVSTGTYQSRKLVLTYYELTKDYTAGALTSNSNADMAAEAAKEGGYFRQIDAAAVAEKVKPAQSDVQYYYIRLCAQRVLYMEANIMAGKNGYDLRKFADKTMTKVAQGSAVNQSVAVDMGATEAYYEVIGGSLPEGLTLAEDGTLSGTPVGSAGTFTFTVRAVYDKWVRTTADMTIEVTPAFSYAEAAAAEYGQSYTGAVDTTVFVDNAKTYALEGTLPAGLSLDTATGEIVGTPTELGTFGFTVVVTVTSGNNTAEYNVPVTITVGGEEPTGGKTEIELLEERIAALEAALGDTDLAEELAAIKADIAALEGSASSADLDALESRVEALEKAGENGDEGGCGSLMGIGVTGAVLAAAAIGFAVFAFVKKRGKDAE